MKIKCFTQGRSSVTTATTAAAAATSIFSIITIITTPTTAPINNDLKFWHNRGSPVES